jgi:hypothetical protein
VSDSPWVNRLAGLADQANTFIKNGLSLPGPQALTRLGEDMWGQVQANNQAIKAGGDALGKKLQGVELTPGEQSAYDESPINGFGGDGGGPGSGFMGTFAGRAAKSGWTKRGFSQATHMEARGTPIEDIRQKTGWQRGHDGEWKFEISDHKAEIRTDPSTGQEILHHPELRRAYPDIIDSLKIERFDGPSDALGRYDPDTNTMYLNRQLTDPHTALSVALHEIQHPIQMKEGFSTGASTGMAPIHRITDMEGDAMRERHYKIVDGIHDEFQNWMAPLLNRPKYAKWGLARFQDEFDRLNPDLAGQRDAARDALNWMDTPHGRSKRVFDTYERAMGEYEARETQHRMDFTPDERKDIPPYSHGRAIPPERLIDMRMFPGENGIPITAMDPATIEIGKGMGTLSPETKALIISALGLGVTNKTAE